jgi:hypothetical protein
LRPTIIEGRADEDDCGDSHESLLSFATLLFRKIGPAKSKCRRRPDKTGVMFFCLCRLVGDGIGDGGRVFGRYLGDVRILSFAGRSRRTGGSATY